MDPKIARNQNHDDHYADDCEDVHFAALTFNNDAGARCSNALCISAIRSVASFRNRLVGSTKARQAQVSIIASACIPNINEVHIFLQNIWQGFASPTRGRRITFHQLRILPTREFF
jgi:hypothetical protein